MEMIATLLVVAALVLSLVGIVLQKLGGLFRTIAKWLCVLVLVLAIAGGGLGFALEAGWSELSSDGNSSGDGGRETTDPEP